MEPEKPNEKSGSTYASSTDGSNSSNQQKREEDLARILAAFERGKERKVRAAESHIMELKAKSRKDD